MMAAETGSDVTRPPLKALGLFGNPTKSAMPSALRTIVAICAEAGVRTVAAEDLAEVAPEGTTVIDIYRGAIPFVGLQALGMVIVMIFPQLALWLPSIMWARS